PRSDISTLLKLKKPGSGSKKRDDPFTGAPFSKEALRCLGPFCSCPAIWILVANSWMQTPGGYHLAREVMVGASGKEYSMSADLRSQSFKIRAVLLPEGYVVKPEDVPHVPAVIDDFGEAILNRSTLDWLCHTIPACWITGPFRVVTVSSWWLLRGLHVESASGLRSKPASPSPRSPAYFKWEPLSLKAGRQTEGKVP